MSPIQDVGIDRPMRVLVTGSREFRDVRIIRSAIESVRGENPDRDLIIVHGGANGADRIAGSVARRLPYCTEEVHEVTDWRREDGTLDRSAGHRRNQRMVDAGAEVCLAFFSERSENRGTKSCSDKARVAGIQVRTYWDV